MRTFLLTAMALGSMQAVAAPTDAANVSAAIGKIDPSVKVQGTRASAAEGMYRTTLDGVSGYVTADGRYFIIGDMYDVKDRRNLTEDLRKEERLAALSTTDAANSIVFSPPQAKHTVTVFTDIDCPYCRKLHSEIAKYNEHGIAVRYMAFPRSGPGTDSWHTMEAVWCSKDRRDALTRAKLGEKIAKPASCETKDVASQYALGEQLGVQGTPTIVMEDGSVVGGYMPPDVLAQELERKEKARTASLVR